MKKLDLKKDLKHLYRAPSTKVVNVDVPEMNFLMIDGEQGPESQMFKEAIEALYPVAYTLKFMVKKGPLALDYGVMPLQGLWWADDMTAFVADKKEQWKWTLMIMQPDFITADMVSEAIDTVSRKKKPVALPLLRFNSYREGECAQIMHLGPFSEEGPTIERLHAHIKNAGDSLVGKHHEIYLSDTRRAAPENWKTVLRQPFSH